MVTDYGIIDDLCDFCVAYGAMPVLEEVLSSRMSSEASQDVSVHQHTVAALARICIYCETHKHFNFLYNFQVQYNFTYKFKGFSFSVCALHIPDLFPH